MANHTFRRYVRCVLPLDGWVFWIRPGMLSPGALCGSMGFNVAQLNQMPRWVYEQIVDGDRVDEVEIDGSLHYSTETRQDEDHTYAVNTVVFNATEPIVELNARNPQVLYVGEFEGVRYAFSRRDSFYRPATIQHYVGKAIYSDTEPMLVDRPQDLDVRSPVVSNSLPVWLSMNSYESPSGIALLPFRLYPSFLVPGNLRPPFGAVHCEPSSLQAIAGAPTLGPTLSHEQLAQETVRITVYGARNRAALDFVDFVQAFSMDGDLIGIMNQPIMRDEKRPQSEFEVLAMKKTVEYQVNFYQSVVRTLAQRLIVSAVPSYYVDGQRAAA